LTKEFTMPRGLVGAIAGVSLAATVSAQEPAPLDRVVHNFQMPAALPPCGLATAVYDLARKAGLQVGFERAAGCTGSASFPRLDRTAASDTEAGLKASNVLDRLLMLAPEYGWLDMNGVAVIRPRSAWTDPNDGLNVRIPAFHAPDASISQMLATILNLPGRVGGDGRRFSVDFPGGTVAEALSAIVRTQPSAIWAVSVLVHPSPTGADPSPGFTIQLLTLPDGPGVGMSTPLPRLRARR
jgi:hypothetical protein